MQQKSNHSNSGNKSGKKQTNWDRYISKEAGTSNKSVGKNSFGKSKFGGSKSGNGQGTGSKFGGSKSGNGQGTGSKFGGSKNGNAQDSNSKFATTKKLVKKVTGVKSAVSTKKVKKVEMLEMYYMTDKEITSKELLNSVEESDSVIVQVWEEIGVGSIEFGDSGSVDFVKCNDVFEYQEDLDFLEEHHIKSAFEVSFEEKNMFVVAKWFLSIINEHGGFFCTDSDDFMPIYKKEELQQWR